MKSNDLLKLTLLATALLASGCIVRTYPLTRDRIDQDLTAGNKGYLKGTAPQTDGAKERKSTRTTQIVEIELGSPIRFEKLKKAPGEKETPNQIQGSHTEEGNKGYLMQSESPEIAEQKEAASQSFENYTVQKNDTLQKISQKFFGTTKRWHKIYKANTDVLKGPDKLRAGQVLKIPSEGLKVPKENLK